jgi:Holliday junction resolvasome RuvABC endonuclease subunit
LAAPLPPDAADAVGVAMTHLLHHGFQARLEAQGLLQTGGGR